MNERLPDTPRRARVVVLEDEDDLEELVELWLARHGLKTVPIGGGGGRPARPNVGATPAGRISARSVLIGGAATRARDVESLEPRLSGREAPTGVMVAEPGLDGPGAGRPDLGTWVDALQAGLAAEERDHIRLGPLDISAARRSVRVEEADVHLTPTEFRLLCYLVEHAERVVGHGELLHSVWGPGYEDDIHLLQVTIRSLRARIELVTSRPLIESVYGVGYRMATCPVEHAPAS